MNFLCPITETTASRKSNSHQLAIAVSLSVGCTLMISFTLLVYWLYYCRWRLPFSSDGILLPILYFFREYTSWDMEVTLFLYKK